MTCERCCELQAELDAVRDELAEMRDQVADYNAQLGRLVRVSPAHPSLQDPCPARGQTRPNLSVVRCDTSVMAADIELARQYADIAGLLVPVGMPEDET